LFVETLFKIEYVNLKSKYLLKSLFTVIYIVEKKPIMKILLMIKVFIFFVFYNVTISAQNEDLENITKNAIYVNGSYIYIYGSANINFDVLIKQPKRGIFKTYYLNFETGIFNRKTGFLLGESYNGVYGGLGVIGLTGKKLHHFEFGLGILFNSDIEVENDVMNPELRRFFVLPSLDIGYRVQIPNRPMIRAGLSIPNGVYLGVGYSF